MRYEEAFRDWATARRESLRRSAFLMCGDWHLADDLVQECLVKLYSSWSRVSSLDHVDAYARKTLVHVYLDHLRRPARREFPRGEAPDAVAREDSGSDYRDQLMNALREVPPKQRAVLVLRYWEDLSVEQTAAVLGVSVGTVKSQASRGLSTLREAFEARNLEIPSQARMEAP